MVSNRTLVGLLVLAIIVSLGGTLVSLNKIGSLSGMSLTGKVTDSGLGTASLEITSTTSITLTNSAIDFGAGYINTTGGGVHNCTMDSQLGVNSADCIGFNTLGANSGFVIENSGNQNVSLRVNVSSDAATLIGGASPAPSFQLKTRETAEAGSCSAADLLNDVTWQEITADTQYTLCNNTALNYDDSKDELYLDVKVVIPSDAPAAGAASATFTFEADDTQ